VYYIGHLTYIGRGNFLELRGEKEIHTIVHIIYIYTSCFLPSPYLNPFENSLSLISSFVWGVGGEREAHKCGHYALGTEGVSNTQKKEPRMK
jgi:hypothetical protein